MEGKQGKDQDYWKSLYKCTGNICDQEKRRKELLEEQKRRRDLNFDESRDIEDDDIDDLEVPANEDVELATAKGSSWLRQRKTIKLHANKLMLSEWLITVPKDLAEMWYMKVCPKGNRRLVVADRNGTRCHYKSGYVHFHFKSALHNHSKRFVTIMDCVWNQSTQKFYVLDVLKWNNTDLKSCEAEFRFFWLQTKLKEHPELSEISATNQYPFIYVDHLKSDFSTMQYNFSMFPFYDFNVPEVDGVLFYHKQAIYQAGSTPLVGWLEPFMLQDKFNIFVAPEYIPTQTLSEYLESKVKKYSSRRKKKSRVHDEPMEN